MTKPTFDYDTERYPRLMSPADAARAVPGGVSRNSVSLHMTKKGLLPPKEIAGRRFVRGKDVAAWAASRERHKRDCTTPTTCAICSPSCATPREKRRRKAKR